MAQTETGQSVSEESLGLRMARGSAYTFASTVLIRGLSVVQGVLAARIIGVRSLGVLALVGVVSGLVSLFSSFALDSSVIKLLAKWRSDARDSSSVISTFLVASLTLAVPFAVALTVLSPFLGTLFGEPQLAPLLVIMAFTLVSNAFLRVFPTVQQAYERIAILSRLNIVASVVAAVSTIGFALAWGLVGVIVAQLLVSGASLVLHVEQFYRHPPVSVDDWFRLDSGLLRELLALSAPQVLVAAIESIAYSIGPSLLVASHGFSALGLLRIDQSTAMLLLILPTSVVVPFLPVASAVYSSDRSTFDRLYLRSCKYALLVTTPFALILTSFPGEVLDLLYSSQYMQAAPAMPLFVGTVVGMSFLSVSGWIYLISGRLRRMVVLYLFSFALLTLLNLVLIPGMSFWGAGLALFVTILADIAASWVIIRREYSRHLNLSFAAVILGLGMALWGLIAAPLPGAVRLLGVIGLGVVAGIASRFILSDEDREFFSRLPRRLVLGPKSISHSSIVVFAPRFFPAIGGVEKHVLRTSVEMTRTGSHVLVVTRPHAQGLAIWEEVDGVRVFRLQSKGRIPLLLELVRLLPELLGAKAIHCHDYVTYWYWLLPFRLAFPWKRTFVTFHGFEGYPPPHRAIWRRRLVALLATDYFCVGDVFEKYYGTPSRNVTLGAVDLELVPDGGTSDKLVRATFVGRLEPDTNVTFFLGALAILRQNKGVQLPLEVCGSGSQLSEAKETAEALKLDVVFRGWVENPAPILKRSRFAFASGYLSVLESLAAGCITFAFAGHPIREEAMRKLHAPLGAFMICKTPEELAGQIGRFITETPSMMRASMEAIQFAAPLSWSNLTRVYLARYGVHSNG